MDKKEIIAHTIDCENRQMSFFDKETIEPLCKVQILENTVTGDVSWGWQRRNPEEIWDLVCEFVGWKNCIYCKFDRSTEECRTCDKDNCSHFKQQDSMNDLEAEFIEELMKDGH